jgi:hypothetical protein
MKRTLPLLLLASWLVACGGLPAIVPVADSERPAVVDACLTRFPAGPWTVVHGIRATMPGGHHGLFIGATAATDDQGSCRSVLMSVEGFVLFDARFSVSDGNLQVHRVLPPLDAGSFAQGLMADVRLLLFPPAGEPERVGTADGGHPVCRWRLDDGGVEDVVLIPDGSWLIRSFAPDGALVREARATGPVGRGFAGRLELRALGARGYSLVLELVEVESAGGSDG